MRVTAQNDVGLSTIVPVTRDGVILLVEPTQIAMPTVLEKTDDSIIVSWVPSNSQASHELFWDAGVLDNDLQLLVTTEESSFTVSNLQSGRTYSF